MPSWLVRGVFRRRAVGWRQERRSAVASRKRRLGRPGTPPGRHYDLSARSSLHGSGGNARDGSAALGPKSPQWSAERRACPDRKGRAKGASQAPFDFGCLASTRAVSALRSPSFGEQTASKLRARSRRGNDKARPLFEIVGVYRIESMGRHGRTRRRSPLPSMSCQPAWSSWRAVGSCHARRQRPPPISFLPKRTQRVKAERSPFFSLISLGIRPLAARGAKCKARHRCGRCASRQDTSPQPNT